MSLNLKANIGLLVTEPYYEFPAFPAKRDPVAIPVRLFEQRPFQIEPPRLLTSPTIFR